MNTGNAVRTHWTKSSFSGENGGCLQVRWTKSSFSGEAGGCLQSRTPTEGTIEVGDTKNPHGPTLIVTNDDWDHFLDQVATNAHSYTGRLQPHFLPDGGFTLHDTATPSAPTLTFTAREWVAFRNGVHAGELRPLTPAGSP